MSSTQFWVGMLVPPIIKWLRPVSKKYFKLDEYDDATKSRIRSKQYPGYYAYIYGLWITTILGGGFAALLIFMIFGTVLFPDKSYAVPVFLGLINMLGVWFILGALLDAVFWGMSSEKFRDYVMLRQLKEGWGYDINQQISTLFKIGLIYYLIMTPLILVLLFI